MNVSASAHVVIADYFYLFNPFISDIFLKKIGKSLSDCIIIVDEGHNLGKRVQELLTSKLSSFMIDRGKKEAEKFKFPGIKALLSHMGDALDSLSHNFAVNDEILHSRSKWIEKISGS